METVFNVIVLLISGLVFFLFGMGVMSEGLSSMAGGKLEKAMKKITSNDLWGFFMGTGVTMAIQSSSAFTVMLIGLVNSGIIDFLSTFGMIMGSNVGTTLTAWLLSLSGLEGSFFISLLNPSSFAPLLAGVGIVMQMFSKNDKKRQLGNVFIGFSILICGMDFMSSSMAGVRTLNGFDTFLATLKSPIIALLVSTVFTGIIQSSSATIGIIQALALTGAITWQMAIPLVLGANIGTCITALISAIGTNKNAKRVVVLHFSVNIFGSAMCMAVLYALNLLGVGVLSSQITIVGVAVIHTLFNLVSSVILLPVKKWILKFCIWVVPDKVEQTHTAFLDERIFQNSALSIFECHRLANEMAEYSKRSITKAINLINDYDKKKAMNIANLEKMTDKYEDRLGTYLVRISSNNLSKNDSHAVGRMLHSIGDFERIADHALNICQLAEEMSQKGISFSKDAKNELLHLTAAVNEIVDLTVFSFKQDDSKTATKIEPLEQVIDLLNAKLKQTHINRLRNNDCTIELGFIFTDLLTNFERVSDHCSNIAVYTMQLNSDKLDTHKYLNAIKSTTNQRFMEDFDKYANKYSL